MESTPDDLTPADAARLHETQREMKRAEAAPYVDYPRMGAWYPLAVGLWAAGLVGSLTQVSTHPVLAGAGILVLTGVEICFVRWYSQRHGALPLRWRRPPLEFRPVFSAFAVGCGVVVAVTTAAWVLFGHLPAVISAFLVVAVGIALYERTYAVAAAATKARLG